MGLDYHLFCADCNEVSGEYEYSIVGYIESKYPDECENQVRNWTKFMTLHSNHRIQLRDAFDRESDPSVIKGYYVLGITKDQFEKPRGLTK